MSDRFKEVFVDCAEPSPFSVAAAADTSQIPSEQALEPLKMTLNSELSAGGISADPQGSGHRTRGSRSTVSTATVPALDGELKDGPDESGVSPVAHGTLGAAAHTDTPTVKAPVWVIAGDPSNSRSGAAVFKFGKPVLSIEYCPWDKVHTGLFKCELNDLSISVNEDEDVLIVCEVPGHGAHFSRDQVNRSAGMLVDLVQFKIRGIDNLKKRVLFVPPVSWRKKVYGAALRGVEKHQWKSLAIYCCWFLFGVQLGNDAAEAMMQAYAYLEGYDFTKKKKKVHVLPDGTPRKRGRPKKTNTNDSPTPKLSKKVKKGKKRAKTKKS